VLLERWLTDRGLPAGLGEDVRYAVLSPGKRVRPLLVLEACAALGGSPDEALPAAAAIELVHAHSLVHDDLPALDDDDLRRGRPTLHVRFGEAMAVLAGDALLGLAFELLSSETPSRELAAGLCRELSGAANDMISGQVRDTLPEREPGREPLDALLETHRLKTGALIRCSCRMGALCGGADEPALDALTRFGEAVGLMFQVVDDVLDATQTTEHLGKTARKDEEQGKRTFPAMVGLDGSLRRVRALEADAEDALRPLGPGADALRELSRRLARRTR